MDGLTEGRIVHYVMPTGVHRPAIVVQDWREPSGSVNLQVFTDGTNDYRSGENFTHGLYWATSAEYEEAGVTPHTWHWIEKA